MPNKDGLEIIIDLRASCPQTKIISISGEVTSKNMLPAALAVGAVHSLNKPFQPLELLTLVEEVLRPGE